MEYVNIILYLLGGLGIFIYGMTITSSSLEQLAAKRMKSFLHIITNNRFLGVLLGIVLTVFMQSSSALTVLVVSLVSASMLNLKQALGMVLGSAVGTTLTVQLIAFKITDYALLAIALGVIFILFNKAQLKLIGQVILGFGFVFYGMSLMSSSMEPLKNYDGVVQIILQLSDSAIILIIVSTIFTAIVQGSAATIALAMTLASQGLLTLDAVIPIVFGANIGTTTTALLSSIGSSREAKRVALAHLIFKVVGVVILLPFLQYFTQLIQWTSSDVSRQIANGHTIYNVINLLVFLPFVSPFAALMERILPNKLEGKYKALFINPSLLDVPELALQQSKKEIIHVGKIIQQELFGKIKNALESGNEKVIAQMVETEKQIDEWYNVMNRYLSEIAKRNLTEEQSEEEIKLLYAANDLENIGDILIVLSHYGEKLKKEGIQLTEKDWQELQQLCNQINHSFQLIIDALDQDNEELAMRVIHLHPKVLRIEKDLRFQHFNEYSKDERALKSTSIHLDMVADLIRLHHHIVSIAQTKLGII